LQVKLAILINGMTVWLAVECHALHQTDNKLLREPAVGVSEAALK